MTGLFLYALWVPGAITEHLGATERHVPFSSILAVALASYTIHGSQHQAFEVRVEVSDNDPLVFRTSLQGDTDAVLDALVRASPRIVRIPDPYWKPFRSIPLRF